MGPQPVPQGALEGTPADCQSGLLMAGLNGLPVSLKRLPCHVCSFVIGDKPLPSPMFSKDSPHVTRQCLGTGPTACGH